MERTAVVRLLAYVLPRRDVTEAEIMAQGNSANGSANGSSPHPLTVSPCVGRCDKVELTKSANVLRTRLPPK